MDSTSGINFAHTPSGNKKADPPPVKPPEAQGTDDVHQNQVDTLQMAQALSNAGDSLRTGEKLTYSFENGKVTVSKEGPDRWAKFKEIASDTTRTGMKVLRGTSEQDPSLAFRGAIDASKVIIGSLSPGEEVGKIVEHQMYPIARCVLTAVDIAKAIQTRNDKGATTADKIADYAHVGTDALGIVAVAPDIARMVGLSKYAPMLAIPGAPQMAALAVIGDVMVGAYHILRMPAQAPARFGMKEAESQGGPTPSPVNPKPTEAKTFVITPEAKTEA
jgi:hypothetical protein